ncbi:MAG: acyl-ACP--UDP-N-acetylglucosamine O-acyltransferase [Candidatus Krumholzibacteria bacterium]|nr:acyl-ACP--UDP-N-acetylglucosamine O-acyltransferase [Candidatus Krumholzibacteria bacterium]
MSTEVHGAAIVHDGAELGKDVTIGPYSVIGPDVKIGEGTSVASNVLIDGHTTIGAGNTIFHGAVLGTPPQDLKYRGARSSVRIGDNNMIREYATVNTATNEGDATIVGSGCLMMAYSHVAHDCIIGDNVILANAVNLAGHVTIYDHAILGGMVPVHQFVRIGVHSFVGGGSRVAKDVLPYVKVAGSPPKVSGLNTVGLKRRGFEDSQLDRIKAAYRLIYRSGLNVTQAIERIEIEIESSEEIEILLDFIRGSQRGITL